MIVHPCLAVLMSCNTLLSTYLHRSCLKVSLLTVSSFVMKYMIQTAWNLVVWKENIPTHAVVDICTAMYSYRNAYFTTSYEINNSNL